MHRFFADERGLQGGIAQLGAEDSQHALRVLRLTCGEEIELVCPPQRYLARIERIERNWDKIQRIIADEIPPYEYALSIMQAAGGPTSAEEIGESHESVEDALAASQEIRD